jgi:hypothetical protein
MSSRLHIRNQHVSRSNRYLAPRQEIDEALVRAVAQSSGTLRGSTLLGRTLNGSREDRTTVDAALYTSNPA